MPFRNFWNNVKKHKRAVIGSALACAVTIPIIVLTVEATKHPMIFSVGSSAVKPMIEKFAAEYNQTQAPNFDLIVDGGGSGTGIQAVAKGTTNVGNASREPKQTEAGKDGTYAKQWQDNKIKTVTIGWDSIGIVYKAPTSFNLNLTPDNIWILYAAMTGVYTGNNLTLGDLMPGTNDSTVITAYSRSGGANKSGTADAFRNDSHLDINDPVNTKDHTYDKKSIQSALESGTYDFNRPIETTNESNIETWKRITSDNKLGSITYLSGAFILNNYDVITKQGFKVATYQGQELSPTNFSSVGDTYGWVRPINCIFSLNESRWSSDQLFAFKNFIKWILYSPKANKTFKSVWLAPVIPAQKEKMGFPSSITADTTIDWKSDYELSPDGKQFGATWSKVGVHG